MNSEDLSSRVLYRDPLMIIIDKPAGLPVHAGPGKGANLEAKFGALRFGNKHVPALAHRLDRDTSGCLILGRNRKGLAKLGRLFQSGQVEKTYWAIVSGAPPADRGTVDAALKKAVRRDGWRMIVAPKGQEAVTDYRVLGRGRGITWLELRPHTGRTHQIRVHCADLGCPVLGDDQYGHATGGGRPDRLQLHARAVVVPLYPNKAPIAVIAEPPAHMRALLRACGWQHASASAQNQNLFAQKKQARLYRGGPAILIAPTTGAKT